MTINSFVAVVQDAQHNGTLEVLLTTATPAPLLIVLSAISSLLQNAVQFALYLAAGLLLAASPLHVNVLAAATVILLSVVIVTAIGLIAAALQLALQKGSGVVWLIGSLSWLMAGTIFPTTALPNQLRA